MICILGEILEFFDDDGKIFVFGFGDVLIRDRVVFFFRVEVGLFFLK